MATSEEVPPEGGGGEQPAEGGTVEREGAPAPDDAATRARRVPLFFAHPSDFDSPEEMAAAIHEAILGSGQDDGDEEE